MHRGETLRTGSHCSSLAILLAAALLTLSGCRYDGSFMHLNSDAPFPFFGLQLSVRNDVNRGVTDDSRVPPVPVAPASEQYQLAALEEVADTRPAAMLASAEFTSTGNRGHPLSPDLVPTSSTSENRSRIRRSLDTSPVHSWISADDIHVRVNEF